MQKQANKPLNLLPCPRRSSAQFADLNPRLHPEPACHPPLLSVFLQEASEHKH